MTETDAPTEHKKPKHRSPPYPAISLDKAIERARSLYEKAMHHPVNAAVPAKAWDYAVKSSGLFATIAALKQYGLLGDNGTGGKRAFTLTERAIRIVRDPDPNSPKRMQAIKDAALSPKINKELWDRYGESSLTDNLDVMIKTYLTLDRAEDGEAAYGDKAADELLDAYKKSMSFAGLSKGSDASLARGDSEDTDDLQFAIGDLINWESGGQIQWKSPRKIVAVDEYDGLSFYKVTGPENEIDKEGWIPVEQAIQHEGKLPAAPSFAPPPPDPTEREQEKAPEGFRKAVFPLDDDCDVTLVFPKGMTSAQLEDLDSYLRVFLGKEKKKVGGDG
jgi:hypothetical protein